MIRQIRFLFILIGAILSSSSCNKLLDVDATNLINEENTWSSITDTRAALLGTYGLLRAALAENNAHWVYGELRGGPFESSSRRDLRAVISGDLKANQQLITDLSNWRRFYAVINAANIFIERSGAVLDTDPQYTNINHAVDVAQMRALKGFTYFLLARIWGDVPIWRESYDGVFPRIPKSDTRSVLAYAENELLEAVKVLPVRYAMPFAAYMPGFYYGQNFSYWDGSLVTSVAANAMLAHIAAWDGRYMDYADFVINNAAEAGVSTSTVYDLTRADGFFLNVKSSQMFALGMAWDRKEATSDGHIENLALADPLIAKPVPDIYIPADRIVSIFNEPGDDRFRITAEGEVITSYFTNFTSARPIFSKIKAVRDGSGSEGNLALFSSPIVFSRLEEILLLKAEALAVTGEIETARNALNDVRYRRNLPDVPMGVDVIDEIFKERSRELLGEGWAWYDLVRYNKIKGSNTAFNNLIQSGGIYWPIAREVLSNNSSIRQNAYWN